MVIEVDTRDSCLEKRVKGNPQAQDRLGGSRTARGKASAWSRHQQARLTEPIKKKTSFTYDTVHRNKSK
jgi:YD repeat-containing protein